MATWHDIDTSTRINGDLAIPIGSITIKGNEVWHEGNDGEDSGLNADMVDDIHGHNLLRKDQDQTFKGNLTIEPSPSSSPGLYLDLSYNDAPSYGIIVDMDGESDDYFVDFRSAVDGDTASPGETKFKISATGRVDANGDMFVNGDKVWHSGNDGEDSGLDADTIQGIDPSVFVRADVQSITFDGSLTAKSTIWAGGSSSDGDVVVRNSAGDGAIQLDGASNNRLTDIEVYIGGDGNADFNGEVTVNSLAINTESLIENLNAEKVGGTIEPDLTKNHSIEELGGYGVYDGADVTPQSGTQVLISTGTVYSSSGRRVVIADTSLSLQPSSDSYDRYDVVYIEGESAGANEGEINRITGTPALNPIIPSIPSDAVRLANIRMKANGTVETAIITEAKDWKPVKYRADRLYVRTLEPGTYSSNKETAVFDVPIKNSLANNSITFRPGDVTYTWDHGLNLDNYAVRLSCNSFEPHIRWQYKEVNSITIQLDDICEDEVIVDVSLEAY